MCVVCVLCLRVGVLLACLKLVLPGTEVPSATKAMAVTESLSPTEQPNALDTSPIIAVNTPIQVMEMQKQSQPPIRSIWWWFIGRAARTGWYEETSSRIGLCDIS